MVFLWNLSDSQSPQVPRTLLSIQAGLNNATVWMLSTHHLVSNSFSPCSNPFRFESFFSSLARSWYLSLFSLSLSLTQRSTTGTATSTIWHNLFFVVDYHKVWLSSRNKVIRFYLKIPKTFARLIF